MTWCWLGLGLAWLMMWHAYVLLTWTEWHQHAIIRNFRHMVARQKPGRHVLGLMRVRFSSYVDWRTSRPSWQHVYPKVDVGVKNLWWRMGHPKIQVACVGTCRDSGWSEFWVFHTEGWWACMYSWFLERKACFAQIWDWCHEFAWVCGSWTQHWAMVAVRCRGV